jgi:hypothetical protein
LIALPVGLVAMLYLGLPARWPAVLLALVALAVAGGAALGSAREGFSPFGENRPGYWRVAWKDARAHPLLGSGTATFGNYWYHHRPSGEFVHDAHSLYLESLAELGPVGLLLVVASLGIPLVSVAGRRDPVVAAAGGGYATFLVHAAVDWDWEMPAVTLTGLLCGAAILVGTRTGRESALSTPVRALLLAAAIALAVLAGLRLESSGTGAFHL